jgi:isoleucyl-tRNA synthetase
MADTNKDGVPSFKDSLNLPRTDFPIRPNAKVDDPAMIERWSRENLFTKSFYQNLGNPRFILHDGPPYANGNIHVGHAYNKTLKDIVGKSQRMAGKQVPITPGWDCHGLPIEFKVTQENPGLQGVELKKACRAYAQKWIEIQREEFKALGVLMDWDRYYSTMSFEYESVILRSFGTFVSQGYIERKNKTVPWCPSCQTVLATAEIEYQDRKDPSIYVMFELESSVVNALFPKLQGTPVSLLIWTTTPWTLPLNRAVMLRPDTEYVILQAKGQNVIVATALADQVAAKLEVPKEVLATFKSDDLVRVNARAYHPFVQGLLVPILVDQSVELGEGTACVHSAPGAGPIDYDVGVKNNLEIYSPVGPDGKYTQAIEPKELAGTSVADGQIWVLKKLIELNKLLFKGSIRHSYPHCWRCHNGLIFRATKQWFLDLSKNNLKDRTLKLADTIYTVPETGINRLKATLEGRLEWCLSRQRVWGVPIPALICTECDYTYTSKEFVDGVADGVLKEGIEYWDRVQVIDLISNDFTCPGCKGSSFEKEYNILDVWFDSGVSHQAVLRANKDLGYPADMYLEGKDQHRGWFQSSLLTSVALEGTPSMKSIVTHGYTVDADGRKMSKSLGNVVSPAQMREELGTDGLRLWAASIGLTDDAVISHTLTRNVQEVFRKVRNTSRFLLSNLYDFDIEKDAVPVAHMRLVDQHAMHELFLVNYQILKAYGEYDFTAVAHKLSDYCAGGLSSYYLDIIKDRLYVEQADGIRRRSAQTACWYILDTLTKLMAPILSITAEQISDVYQKDKKESIHLQRFAELPDIWEMLAQKNLPVRNLVEDTAGRGGIFDALEAVDRNVFITLVEARWELLKELRSAVLKALEEKREKGEIKHSLDSRVTMYVAGDVKEVLDDLFAGQTLFEDDLMSFLKEYLIVSQVELVPNNAGLQQTALEGLLVLVDKARGEKCPRCWNWDENDNPDHLCKRCESVLAIVK